MMIADSKERPSSADCLKHPYFIEIFKETDVIDSKDELSNYDKDYLYALQKKT